MNSLFDRIAGEIAETDADATTELGRPPSTSSTTAASTPAAPDAGAGRDGGREGGLTLAPSWPAPDISTQIERPSAASRQCSRSGCSDTAAVTLSYHYAASQVWIDRLWPERDPHMYDMCEQHAARLSVPRGWHLDDRRGSRHANLIAV